MPQPGNGQDAVGTFFFTLKLGGVESVGFFRECSGFSSEHDVVEQKSSSAKGVPLIQKMPGQMKWSNITLKRGVDKNGDLWKWRKEVVDGKIASARKDGTVQIVGPDGSIIVTFNFVKGWPCKYTAPGLNASGNEVLVEEIEIAHEGFERV